MKHCTKCDKTKPLSEFGKRASAKDGLQGWCRQCMSAYKSAYQSSNLDGHRTRNQLSYEEKRAKAFAHYGKACACCGIADLDVLAIDHINNDGAAHRREMRGGHGIYAWLVRNKFPSGFRTLCHNCNWKAYLAFKRSKEKRCQPT